MRRSLFSLLAVLALLAACEPSLDQYRDSPNKRTANVDDHRISIVPLADGTYVAWGGEEDRDGFVHYRQERGIELVSGCRIKRVLSAKKDDLLHASVRC